ncbi:hypothetical protein BU16DRAFT_532481 [Lophium mytilinum]|uniref:Uncharacterized protein n=1 Tax=Lophium mytilinum TaxID=390894 RepID=A0A6A6REB4_9PEZI|nr:hypothetical protein BU16DRAFT_532481 [Lophium mytilinum]
MPLNHLVFYDSNGKKLDLERSGFKEISAPDGIQAESRLHSLPREIRDMIWEYAWGGHVVQIRERAKTSRNFSLDNSLASIRQMHFDLHHWPEWDANRWTEIVSAIPGLKSLHLTITGSGCPLSLWEYFDLRQSPQIVDPTTDYTWPSALGHLATMLPAFQQLRLDEHRTTCTIEQLHGTPRRLSHRPHIILVMYGQTFWQIGPDVPYTVKDTRKLAEQIRGFLLRRVPDERAPNGTNDQGRVDELDFNSNIFFKILNTRLLTVTRGN